MIGKECAVLVWLGNVCGKFFLEEHWSGRRRAIELAVTDQPMLGVGDDKEALGERHGAIVAKLGCIVRRDGLDKLAMLRACKPVPQSILLILDFSQRKGGLSRVEIGDRGIALDG